MIDNEETVINSDYLYSVSDVAYLLVGGDEL